MKNKNNNNRQSAAKPLKELTNGEGSTTIRNGVHSSEWKWGALLKNNEDIVLSLNESLEKFSKKYNYIYRTTCITNNKFYIGRHSTDNLNDSYLGSGKALKNSIKKYGRNKFKKEILYFCNSFEELVLLEKFIVNKYLLKDVRCMNIVEGGMNCILIGKANSNYGKPMSEAQRKNLSDIAKTKTGDKNPFYGRTHSEKTKQIMSNNASKRVKELNPFYSKTHTATTKELISKTNKYNFENRPELRKMISDSKKIRLYHTPFGVFETALEAAKSSNCSKATVLKRCVKYSNCITGDNYQILDIYKSTEKTWKDFGWFFTKLDNE